jgi:hypothetical protein
VEHQPGAVEQFLQAVVGPEYPTIDAHMERRLLEEVEKAQSNLDRFSGGHVSVGTGPEGRLR